MDRKLYQNQEKENDSKVTINQLIYYGIPAMLTLVLLIAGQMLD